MLLLPDHLVHKCTTNYNLVEKVNEEIEQERIIFCYTRMCAHVMSRM